MLIFRFVFIAFLFDVLISKKINFKIQQIEPPKISGKLENVTVNEGDNATFNLKFNGKPKPSIKWFKEEEEIIITEESYEVIEIEDSVSLIIKSVKSQDHTGSYTVKAINDFGEAISNKAILTINRAPKFINVPKDTIVVQDQSIKFECLVDALPKAKLSWFLNGKELTAKDNVKFETDPKTASNNLIIAKVNQTVHLGKFTIKASNAVGENEHSFDLNVLGKLSLMKGLYLNFCCVEFKTKLKEFGQKNFDKCFF